MAGNVVSQPAESNNIQDVFVENGIASPVEQVRLYIIVHTVYLVNQTKGGYWKKPYRALELDSDLEDLEQAVGEFPGRDKGTDEWVSLFEVLYQAVAHIPADEFIGILQPGLSYLLNPIGYLMRILRVEERRALYEFYWLIASRCGWFVTNAKRYKSLLKISREKTLLPVNRIDVIWHSLFTSIRMDYQLIAECFAKLEVNTLYRRCLLYYYALLTKEIKENEVRYIQDLKPKGFHLSSEFPTYHQYLTDQSNAGTYPELFDRTAYSELRQLKDTRSLGMLLIELVKLSVFDFFAVFVPELFPSPAEAIDQMKKRLHGDKTSDADIMSLTLGILSTAKQNANDPPFSGVPSEISSEDLQSLQKLRACYIAMPARIPWNDKLAQAKDTFEKFEIKSLSAKIGWYIDINSHPMNEPSDMTDFFRGLSGLKDISALEFIRYFSDNSEDHAAENSIIFEKLASWALRSNAEFIVFVEPSFSFLEQWLSDTRTEGRKLTVVISNEQIRNFLGMFYPRIQFVGVPDTSDGFDMAVVFCRGKAVRYEPLLPLGNRLGDKSILYAIVPERFFSDDSCNDLRRAFFKSAKIGQVYLMPSSLFRKAPTKKLMIQCYKNAHESTPDTNIPLRIFRLENNQSKNRNLLFVAKPVKAVLYRDKVYLGEKYDIREAYRAQNKSNGQSKRLPPRVIELAPDFRIHYTTVALSNGALRAKCYFAEYLTGKQKERNKKSYGKIIKDSVVTVLVRPSQEVCSEILSRVPNNKNFRSAVVKAILEAKRTGILPGLSLFSFWYCFQDDIGKYYGAYDGTLCRDLLQQTDLGALCLNDASSDDYISAANTFFSNRQIVHQDRYWEQLSFVLGAAVRLSCLPGNRNPIAGYLASRSVANEEFAEVRSALTTKTLSIEAERRLIRWLSQKLPEDARALGVLIRLFTGMSAAEVCMLTWDDYKKIPVGENNYQFRVTKQMHNTHRQRAPLKSPNKYRLVPIADYLYEKLQERLKYVEAKAGASARTIKGNPIVTKIRTLDIPCSVRQLAEISKQALEKGANLPSNFITVPELGGIDRQSDLSDYRGDFFVSNFKYHALNHCAMTPGEICYILGLQPNDTFSRHYCDYSNWFIQKEMADKINDWSAMHKSWDNTPQYRRGTVTAGGTVSLMPTNPDCVAMDLILTIDNSSLVPTVLKIVCARGLSGTITVYNGGECDERK